MNSKTLDNLRIIKITGEYEEMARNLVLEGLLERFGFIDHSYNPDLKDILKTYGTDGTLFLIGFIREELICTGALTKEKEDTGRIQRMSVKKKYRRQGVANRMIKELELLAKEMGYKKIVLETNNNWISAIKFYRKNGYVEYHNDGECTHFIKTAE